MEAHYHCEICRELLAGWPGKRWHKVKVDGRTICYCDGACQEVFEQEQVKSASCKGREYIPEGNPSNSIPLMDFSKTHSGKL